MIDGYEWLPRARALRDSGASYAEIGRSVGASEHRVRYQLDEKLRKKERDRDRLAREKRKASKKSFDAIKIDHEVPIIKQGPWPISYIRYTGEAVYRVGTGHDIPESSLGAFGFVIAGHAE